MGITIQGCLGNLFIWQILPEVLTLPGWCQELGSPVNQAAVGHRGENDRAMDNNQVVQRVAQGLGYPEKRPEKAS